MGKRIAIIQGHPDASAVHLCHALGDAYAQGATAAGFTVERIEVARLDFPLLRSAIEWNTEALPSGLREAQAAIGRADHLVLLFPLWGGSMPALFKGFFEQVMRPDFAFRVDLPGGQMKPGLKGKSARVVVTMGMPALAYRLFYFAHGVAELRRNVLKFSGVNPVRLTYIGGVESEKFNGQKWLKEMRELGHLGR